MLPTLIAALSLALEVPFLPQTDALCGGAAVAMVYRYWGDTHADVQQFAPFVDRRAGGIADDVLVDAVAKQGWKAIRVNGSVDELRMRLRDRQPVIVLLADRRDTYHYVVVTGASSDRIVVHDPSWGPSRAIAESEFVRLWKPTNFWSLVILPGPNESRAAEPAPATSAPSGGVVTDCERRLNETIADAPRRGLTDTETTLIGLRDRCPSSPGPLRELAGVRFAQRRWSEADVFARQALALDAQDEYAWDVLGSSRFMQDDHADALRAWNRIGRPRVDRVRIEGLRRSRYQAIADALAIRSNTLLTAEAFERARRRLHELPDRATARLSLRPEADGFATVDVVITERSIRPHGAAAWAATAARSAVDREVSVAVPGFTGQGELWTASWRWWAERPRVAIGFATPRGPLPGIWRVDASWETQTYAFDRSAAAPAMRESRAHGGVTISDWLTGTFRYSIGAGVDAWDGERKTAFVGGAVERRLWTDRLSLTARATHWSSLSGDRGFGSLGGDALFRSSRQFQRWVSRATVGFERVGEAAPLALWPGAGDGHARAPLLRAHPLLRDGVIDASRSSTFGRTLTYVNAEAQRWFDRPRLARIGVAGFVDVARAGRGSPRSSHEPQIDIGGGLRIKIPGAEGVLRVDVARGIRDGARALTVGWQY